MLLCHTTIGLAPEATRVLLGSDCNHCTICPKLFSELKTVVPPLNISIHQTGDTKLMADFCDHPELSTDGSFSGSHGCRTAMDGQSCDTGGAKTTDESLCFRSSVEKPDLDTDSDLKFRGNVLHESLKNGAELVGSLEKGSAHASARAERFRAASIDIDAGNICSYQPGCFHRAIRVCGADLKDEFVLFKFRVQSVNNALLGIRRWIFLPMRRSTEPL
ncbi:hypothetical protein HG531_011667 [Fusarium graminearum]|nr:hypothetical protein HG531_011667 [Fusarium graminearum]